MVKFALVLVFPFLLSCSSQIKASHLIPDRNYIQMVKKYSVKDELYSGFTNVFYYNATLKTEDVQRAQINYNSRAYQWEESEKRKALRELAESVSNYTEVFVSFYTPDVRNNDLNESGSIWRIFLEVGGKKYLGGVTKISLPPARLRPLYPEHTAWGVPYLVKFPISALDIRDLETKITFTGNLGFSSKVFPKASQ
ncbi:MAG: hypothetical protein AB8E15_06950 [Bdellovibrionales bacterium]